MKLHLFADQVAEAVRDYVARSLTTLAARIDAIEARPPLVAQDGRDGKDGKDGKDADVDALRAELKAYIDALPKPRDGIDGKDGAKGDPGQAGSDGKDGRDGADGRPIDPAEVEASIRKAVDALPKPRDGIDGRDGADGAPGRDGWDLDILPEVDAARSYARGTVACWRGGLIRAVRATDPVGDDIARAGWHVLINAPHEVLDEQVDDRHLVRRTTYTDGRIVEQRYSFPVLIDRGVWRDGMRYAKGDAVTWGGSLWVAQVDDVTTKPGDGDGFRLAVKRGRDGKDGAQGERGEKGRDAQGNGASRW